MKTEHAGIYIGPVERLRVQQLLSSNSEAWQTEAGRADMKYQFAPMLCRNRTEQELFYKIYDDFLKEPLPNPPPPAQEEEAKEAPEEKRSVGGKWLWRILGAIALGAGIWAAYQSWFNQPQKNEIVITFSEKNGKSEFAPGETATFVNTTNPQDTAGLRFLWVMEEGDIDTVLRLSGDTAHYLVPDPGRNPNNFYKQIYLEAYDRATKNRVQSVSATIQIVCPAKPDVQGDIRSEGEKQPDKKVKFFAPADLEKGWEATWEFGDGETSKIRNPEHIFRKAGTYNVSLTIADTTQNGYCSTIPSTQIKIGGSPEPAQQALVGENINRNWVFTIWWVLLFYLFAICFLYFFTEKWWHRPIQAEPMPVPQVSALLQRAFETKDRPPYVIPYRSTNSQIRLASEQLELANILRRRQAGQQAQLHIPHSIAATIEKAGFTDLRFAANTRPTQYLFLIDLQNEASHQAQLFQYLVEMLVGQEVLAEVFFCKNDLDRFWNRARPDGISLDHLAMYYGGYRLVIFGDAYRLLAGNNEKGHRLKPYLTEGFQRWPQRMLVTPVPVSSWTYKEAWLYRLFAVFHADLSGLMQAARFAEKGMDEETLPPTFAEWEKQFKDIRANVDTDRLWQTLEHHRDYLKETKYGQEEKDKIYAWLRALVVYPELTWNMTIAIGRKLGIDVRYEHLLLLARIPWLQEGVMKTSLWRAWWQEPLPKSEENLARQAIQEELRAVAEKTEDGFADQKVQTRLAVQDFALASSDLEKQNAIRFIYEKSSPSRQLREELDLVVLRHQPDFPAPDPDAPLGKIIEAFLTKGQKATRLFFTRDFWLSCLSALGFVLWFWLTAADAAYPLYKIFSNAPLSKNTPYEGIFVKQIETAVLDSASRLNIQAVDIWNGQAPPQATPQDSIAAKAYWAIRLLDKAIKIRPDFELAKTNRARIFYNYGIYQLGENPVRAISFFREALSNDSLRSFAAEALSIAFYLNGQMDSACFWINRAMALDRNYSNWLAAIGGCDNPVCRQVANVGVAVGFRNRVLTLEELNEIFRNPNSEVARRTLITAIPRGQIVELIDSSRHFWKVRFNGEIGYVAKSVNSKPTLLPCDLTLADRDNDGTPNFKDGCPFDKAKTAPGICGCGKPDTDTDGDRIADCNDNCPDKPGTFQNNGCPEEGSPFRGTLNGVVRLQNSGRRPLLIGNVQVVFVDAPPTTTDESGRFRLTFVGKKPGDLIFLTEIKKPGFELVNSKELESIRVGTSDQLGVDIVLALAGTVEAAKKRYYNVSDRTLLAYFEREKKALREKMQKAELTQEGYVSQMTILQEQYDRQKQGLDALAEKFARVNLDDVDLFYREALELFNAGDIEGSIRKLESVNLAERTDLTLKQKERISELLESIEELRIKGVDDLGKISGIVSDESGNRLEGVNISIPSCCSTESNSSGAFSLQVPVEYQRTQQRLFLFKNGYKPLEITTPVIPNEAFRFILKKE